MRLFFLRHAEAEDGANDDTRELTAKGREQAARLGAWLRALAIEFDRAYSSPLVRARETAEIVLKAASQESVKLKLVDELRNECGDAGFNQWLRALKHEGNVLLVGHMPTLAAHAARLLAAVSVNAMALPKCGLIVIETEDGRAGRLKCFVSPKFLPD